MSIPGTSTRRPVAVAMLVLAVVLLGVISFTRLPIDLLPDVSFPRLVIYTTYSNVAPAEIERLITERIEQRGASVPGGREGDLGVPGRCEPGDSALRVGHRHGLRGAQRP